MIDLIERLHARLTAERTALETGHNAADRERSELIRLLREAADAIEEARAEVRRQKGQIKRMACEEYDMIQRHKDTEARAERLVEALHKLEDSCEDSDGAQYGTLATSFVRGICKDALRDHDQEKKDG